MAVLSGRTAIWVLTVSLVFTIPSGARVKSVRRPPRRVAARSGPSLPGIIRAGPWTEPAFADSTEGDSITGEDPIVRCIAIRALGHENGSVVIVDYFYRSHSVDRESKISAEHGLSALF